MPPLPSGSGPPGAGNASNKASHSMSKKPHSKSRSRYWETVLTPSPDPSSRSQGSASTTTLPQPPPPPQGGQSNVSSAQRVPPVPRPPVPKLPSGQGLPVPGPSSMVSSPSASSLRGGGSLGSSHGAAGHQRSVPGSRFSAEGRSSRGGSHTVQCPTCGLFFQHRTVMRTHVQQKHNPGKTWPCRFAGCPKVFGHRSSRSRHENMHSTPASRGSSSSSGSFAGRDHSNANGHWGVPIHSSNTLFCRGIKFDLAQIIVAL